MDVDKVRNNRVNNRNGEDDDDDEEEVVFGNAIISPTEGLVKDAVERWERELAAALEKVPRPSSLSASASASSSSAPTHHSGAGTANGSILMDISLSGDGEDTLYLSRSSCSSSFSNYDRDQHLILPVDLYADEYDENDHPDHDYDDIDDENKSIVMELNVLAQSQTILTQELDRLYHHDDDNNDDDDDASPLSPLRELIGAPNQQRQQQQQRQRQRRRPDPPAQKSKRNSKALLERPLLLPLVEDDQQQQQTRSSESLPQCPPIHVFRSADGSGMASIDVGNYSGRSLLPDPEEQLEESEQLCSPERLSRPYPPLPSLSSSSSSSSPYPRSPPPIITNSRRRRSIWRSRCGYGCYCRRVVLVRAMGLLATTVFLLLAIVVPISNQRTQQNLEQQTMHVMDFLISHEISSREDLERWGSPQYQAAQWLAHDQQQQQQGSGIGGWFGPIVGRSPLSVSPEDVLNRYVLAVLYFSLGGAGGNNSSNHETNSITMRTMWPEDWNFLRPAHVCTWNELGQPSSSNSGNSDVDTMIRTPSWGVHACQENELGALVPTGIALSFPGLSGALPNEIRHLSHLQSFVIDHNPAMGGSLPTCIHQLSQLKTLSFPGCSIGGYLPPWIGDLTQLTELNLSDNRLRGSIPTDFLRLSNLQTLRLNGNLIASSLDLFGPLIKLETLHIQDNMIDGVLEGNVLANWTRMVDLDASENAISGSLPSNLFSHQTLKTVNLSANRLGGYLPWVPVEFNANLRSLQLQSNQLEGSIPSSLAQLMALEVLDLSINTMVGLIPESIESLLRLKSLSLSENDFATGSIPHFLFRLENLEKLSLSRSSLTGTVSDSIGFLSHLQDLDLSENALTGTLPPQGLGHLSLLRHLSLRFNQLTGTLPEESMRRLINLESFLLEGNQLTGTAESICSPSFLSNVETAAAAANSNNNNSNTVAFFSSDCYHNSTTTTGDAAEWSMSTFFCSCCNVCCGSHSESCSVDTHPDVWGS